MLRLPVPVINPESDLAAAVSSTGRFLLFPVRVLPYRLGALFIFFAGAAFCVIALCGLINKPN